VKAYYFFARSVLCGFCHYAMYPGGAFLAEEAGDKPLSMRFKCVNEKCSQHAKPIEIPPLEVEIP